MIIVLKDIGIEEIAAELFMIVSEANFFYVFMVLNILIYVSPLNIRAWRCRMKIAELC